MIEEKPRNVCFKTVLLNKIQKYRTIKKLFIDGSVGEGIFFKF